MVLCSRCKKNMAVLFVMKVENGNKIKEGLCLQCAQELGLNPPQIAGNMDLDPEMLENLEEQIGQMIAEAGGEDALGSLFPIFEGNFKEEGKEQPPKEGKKKQKKKSVLDTYGINLTEKAARGEIDRVIGRDTEITRCTEILNRRNKNNPCLIGEPGVGKTAIAEGLAVRIAEGNVPAKLLKKRIYLLDFTAMVAGTQFRGQFEGRLKSLIDEVRADKDIILVIDELHNIVGAGEAEGAMSAANILKPALARGEIQVIGATTISEYRRYIEKDGALERRFQTVSVEEPDIEETIKIIMGIKDYYEKFHSVVITEPIVRSAVLLSERYINDRFQPDKAIDVIDEAASRANLRNRALTELAQKNEELEKIKAESGALNPETESDFARIAELRTKEILVGEEIDRIKSEMKDEYLSVDDIAGVIEGWTKIPARRITQEETQRLLELEETLKERVKGQDEAISSVSSAIRRGRAGLSIKARPVTFLFTGQTGVGKTELVLALSEAVFGSEDALIRLDMSEYMEKHAVSKIIGAPPGYVGYDDGGQLTEKIRRRPYSVILLDEVEKAHPEVLNIFLQIMEDGKVSDSHGKKVSFANSILIMTSNAGADYKNSVTGYVTSEDTGKKTKALDALKEFMRPEFLNRIDEIIVFNALNRDTLRIILKKMLSEFAGKLMEKGIKFEITEEAEELLLQEGYDPKNGARPLRRVIMRRLEDAAAQKIIKGETKENEVFSVYAENGEIRIK